MRSNRTVLLPLLLLPACNDDLPMRAARAQPAVRGTSSEVRIVEPGDGQAIPAGEEIDLVVVQEIRGGPAQGRGWVESSDDGEHWRRLRPDFPWSRESAVLRVPITLADAGVWHVRLLVRDPPETAPFLAPEPIVVEARAQRPPRPARARATPGWRSTP